MHFINIVLLAYLPFTLLYFLLLSLQIKGTLAAALGGDAEGSYDDVLETVTPTQSLTPTAGCCTSKTPIILDVRPKISSAKKSAEEDRIMAAIEESGQ